MRGLVLALLVALLLAPGAASAQEQRETTTFLRGDWRLDAGLAAASGAAFLVGTFALKPSLAQRAPLDGLGHRPRSEPFEILSDAVVSAGIFGSLAMAKAMERGMGRHGIDQWRAPLVLTESVMLASALVHVAKNAAGICRPRDWDDSRSHCDPDRGERHRSAEDRLDEAHRSFPSGHTAPLAALAGASAGLWLLPTRRNPTFFPLTLVTGTLALAMVALRPLAGAHSWVDTSTGLLLGASSGFLVAYLHSRTIFPPAPRVPISTPPVQISLATTF
ncbi:MAG: phosphatase PAP2 family protein [Myxococcales bacterium]|nr:phosphatase PAP2 family protein [Polyangiaceae bacterium]MDW8248084.1 phosphatase PAP2 family protein [Myxococcales bacterium]